MFITNLQVCSNNQENCIWQIRPTWIYGCFYSTWLILGQCYGIDTCEELKEAGDRAEAGAPTLPCHSILLTLKAILCCDFTTKPYGLFGAEQTHGHGQSVSIPHSGGPKGPLSAPEDRHQSRQRQGRSDSFHLRLNSFTVLYCRIYRNLTGERLHWKYR